MRDPRIEEQAEGMEWTDEALWNGIVGAERTPAGVGREAQGDGLTVREWITSAVATIRDEVDDPRDLEDIVDVLVSMVERQGGVYHVAAEELGAVRFVVPPECQGQIVERAYGWQPEEGMLIERVTDASAGTVTYRAVASSEILDDGWEPQNGQPEVADTDWRAVEVR